MNASSVTTALASALIECHKALRRAQEYITQGYKYCVCLDLERFFDTVNHAMLIRILSRTIRDGRVISLIHKYLTAGVIKAVR